AKAECVDDIVVFEGEKPFEQAQQYYRIAKVGVIPHYKYGQTDNTVPHKLAQNMIMGVPTLTSSCHALQRLVGELGIGLSFESGNPDAAAKAILAADDAEKRLGWIDAGLKATADGGSYSWSAMMKTLRGVYLSA